MLACCLAVRLSVWLAGWLLQLSEIYGTTTGLVPSFSTLAGFVVVVVVPASQHHDHPNSSRFDIQTLALPLLLT